MRGVLLPEREFTKHYTRLNNENWHEEEGALQTGCARISMRIWYEEHHDCSCAETSTIFARQGKFFLCKDMILLCIDDVSKLDKNSYITGWSGKIGMTVCCVKR